MHVIANAPSRVGKHQAEMPKTTKERDRTMSEAATAVMPMRPRAADASRPDEAEGPAPAAGASPGQIAELRVSGHLMTLDTGLFCVFQAPGGPSPDPATGLPGVRISVPPGHAGRPDAISISTFRQDGWLGGAAALVRVSDGPAQLLVTVYQSQRPGEPAPRLQVLRLSADAPNGAATPAHAAPSEPSPAAEPEVIAHVQRTGDVGVRFGEWVGVRGSKMWIEGFGISPLRDVAPEDIEYQAVLGRGWLSPWVEAGKFCGSRGMALPLLGLKVRLKGEAERRFACTYSATFTDGSAVGPVAAGETCEAESLAALEAFQINLHPKDAGDDATAPRKAAAKAGSKSTAARPRPAKAR
jgi:hypothetical protein